MGLDKWLKAEETEEKSKKKTTPKHKEKQEEIKESQVVDPKKSASKIIKFILICPNSKCKYQKTIMKKILSDLDKICPRCKKEMKIK